MGGRFETDCEASQFQLGPTEAVAAIVDVETTGFTNSDQLLQMSVLAFCFDKVEGDIVGIVDWYSQYHQPTGYEPAIADHTELNVYGITWADVKGNRIDADRVRLLLEPCEFIVAHNATFDARFCRNCGFAFMLEKPWHCSVHGIDWRAEGMEERSLSYLCSEFGVPIPDHDAENDVRALLELLHQSDVHGNPFLLQLCASSDYARSYRGTSPPIEPTRRVRPQLTYDEDGKTVPIPTVRIIDHEFVFTGRVASFGSKSDCMSAVEALGGRAHTRTRTATDYLVIGAGGSENWIHGKYGKKVADAMRLNVAVISEDTWLEAMGRETAESRRAAAERR